MSAHLNLALEEGLEPSTFRLTAERSAIELLSFSTTFIDILKGDTLKHSNLPT